MKNHTLSLLLAFSSTLTSALPQGPPSNPGEMAPIGLGRHHFSPEMASSVATPSSGIPRPTFPGNGTRTIQPPSELSAFIEELNSSMMFPNPLLYATDANVSFLVYNGTDNHHSVANLRVKIEVTIDENGQEHVKITGEFDLPDDNARVNGTEATGGFLPTGIIGMNPGMSLATASVAFPAQTGGPKRIKVPSPQAPGFKGP
ncbi:MAG: hypothetical protein Q9163_000332 [Psora crenata]